MAALAAFKHVRLRSRLSAPIVLRHRGRGDKTCNGYAGQEPRIFYHSSPLSETIGRIAVVCDTDHAATLRRAFAFIIQEWPTEFVTVATGGETPFAEYNHKLRNRMSVKEIQRREFPVGLQVNLARRSTAEISPVGQMS